MLYRKPLEMIEYSCTLRPSCNSNVAVIMRQSVEQCTCARPAVVLAWTVACIDHHFAANCCKNVGCCLLLQYWRFRIEVNIF